MIEFENVSFSYEGQKHDSLHGISLKIADGGMCLVLWPQRVRKNNGHKAGKRFDPTILPGRTSGARASGRTGNQ